MKILIADDEPDIRMLLAVSLADLPGVSQIIEAADGEEAVQMAERERPDIVILDAIMPRLSGPDALPRIRDVAPAAKVFLFSAVGSPLLETYARELDVEVFPKTRVPQLLIEISTLVS